MMKIRNCILVGLILWITSIANAADYTVPKGVTVLTEDQLMTQVIGNTYVGGNYWVEYYEPSSGGKTEGRIKGKQASKRVYGGNWKINGPLMCWEYDDPKMAAYNDCFTTALDGDTVNVYTIHGIVHTDPAGTITLKLGNPDNL